VGITRGNLSWGSLVKIIYADNARLISS